MAVMELKNTSLDGSAAPASVAAKSRLLPPMMSEGLVPGRLDSTSGWYTFMAVHRLLAGCAIQPWTSGNCLIIA